MQYISPISSQFDKAAADKMLSGSTTVNSEEQRAKEIQALQELKSSLKDQLKPRQVRWNAINARIIFLQVSTSGFESNLDTLDEEGSARKRSMDKQMGLEGTQDEEDAAKLIQNKFKEMKIRKKSATKVNGGGADSGNDFVKAFSKFLYKISLLKASPEARPNR